MLPSTSRAFRSLLKVVRQLLHSWWQIDRIRVPRSRHAGTIKLPGD